MSVTEWSTLESAGVDLGDVDRFATALARSGPALLNRVLTAAEHDCTDDVVTLTAMLSAKESVVKVFGGMPPGGRYADIGVGPLQAGERRPVRLAGAIAGVAVDRRVRLVVGRESAAKVPDGMVLTWALAVRPESRP